MVNIFTQMVLFKTSRDLVMTQVDFTQPYHEKMLFTYFLFTIDIFKHHFCIYIYTFVIYRNPTINLRI